MKQQQMPLWLTRTLIYGLMVIFVVMPFHAFLSTWGGTSIGPLWLWKGWKEVVLVLLSLLTLGWVVNTSRVRQKVLKDPLVIALLLYVALTLGLTAIYWRTNGAEASFAGLAMNLRYIAAGGIAYILFRYSNVSSKWIEKAGLYIVVAGVIVAILGILQVLILPADALSSVGYEKGKTIAPFVVIDNNPNLLRAFATLRGPNDFGAFLILPMLLVFAWARKLPIWVTITLLGLMGWALVLSGSRSAWLGALMAGALYMALVVRRVYSRRRIGLSVVVVVLGLIMAVYLSVTVPDIRTAVFHSSPGDSSLTEGSTDDHFSATVGGIERIITWPLGCGAGCSGPASYYGHNPKISENYGVQIAEEVGIFGLVLLLISATLMAIRLYLYRRSFMVASALLASLAGYVMIGLFLHVWSDDPLTLTWWILAGGVIGYNENQRWIKSKTSLRSRTSYSSSSSS